MALLTPIVRTEKFQRYMAIQHFRSARSANDKKRGDNVRILKIPPEFRTPSFFRSVLVDLASDPRVRVSPQRFARMFSVPVHQVERWWADPKVGEEIGRRLKQALGRHHVLRPIYRKMFFQAKKGSFKHQRLILEMAGHYTPGMRLEHDVVNLEERFRQLEAQRQKRLSSNTPIDAEFTVTPSGRE